MSVASSKIESESDRTPSALRSRQLPAASERASERASELSPSGSCHPVGREQSKVVYVSGSSGVRPRGKKHPSGQQLVSHSVSIRGGVGVFRCFLTAERWERSGRLAGANTLTNCRQFSPLLNERNRLHWFIKIREPRFHRFIPADDELTDRLQRRCLWLAEITSLHSFCLTSDAAVGQCIVQEGSVSLLERIKKEVNGCGERRGFPLFPLSERFRRVRRQRRRRE